MKIIKITLIVILLLAVFLLIPFIVNDRSNNGIAPTKLADVGHSEVFYQNKIDNVNLAGLLMLPKGEGPFPTAIIISGSGSSFRDNWWTLTLVKHLQDNGIAVVVPDKRGCGKSEGEWIGASFSTLAQDANCAVDFVKTQDIFKHSNIGFIGISQGGWIAPLAATKSNDVSFIVSLSGATVNTYEQLLHEETNNISGYTYPFIAKMIAPITTKRLQKMDHLKSYANFDPIPYLKGIDIPVLYSFGTEDKLVPVDACIDRLKENNLNNFVVKTYANGGHALKDLETNTISRRCLDDLTAFIKGIQ